jgi:hypothetical protein
MHVLLSASAVQFTSAFWLCSAQSQYYKSLVNGAKFDEGEAFVVAGQTVSTFEQALAERLGGSCSTAVGPKEGNAGGYSGMVGEQVGGKVGGHVVFTECYLNCPQNSLYHISVSYHNLLLYSLLMEALV